MINHRWDKRTGRAEHRLGEEPGRPKGETSVQPDAAGSIESRKSWHSAWLTLAILTLSFGSPLLAVVGLRDMQAALHTDRSVVALASALVWIGNGIGGIPMGWLADRIGIRKTVALGTVSMSCGMALSSLGSVCSSDCWATARSLHL
jgi:MFS family permease